MGNICCEELEKHYEAKMEELEKQRASISKDYLDLTDNLNKERQKIADLETDNQELKTDNIGQLEKIAELEDSLRHRMEEHDKTLKINQELEERIKSVAEELFKIYEDDEWEFVANTELIIQIRRLREPKK